MMLSSRSAWRLSTVVLVLLCSLPALGAQGNEALLVAYIEVWNNGDLDSLDSIVSDDFVRHGNYGSASSKAELQQLISRSRSFFRDLRIEADDVVAGQAKGAMRWRFSGGFGDASFDLESLNFAMYHFSDGRITHEWVHGNTADFWRSMGYRIMPPGTRMVPPELEDPPDSARVPPHPWFAELTAYAAETFERQATNVGRLEISSDIACRLSHNGTSIGALAAGGSVVLRLAAGSHVVEASSLGGSIFFRRAVKVAEGEAVSLDIAAPGRVTVNLRDRTTEDLASGLMWQMADNGSDITRNAAEAYCSELDQGGHQDWRLPSIHELQEIYSPEAAATRRFHTIDGIHLTGCCPWTNSPHEDFYWTFIFYNGLRYIKHDSIGKASRALCVRHAA